MKKNNLSNNSQSGAEKLMLLLPKSCDCDTCVETKSYIKSEIGEKKFETLAKQKGIAI